MGIGRRQKTKRSSEVTHSQASAKGERGTTRRSARVRKGDAKVERRGAGSAMAEAERMMESLRGDEIIRSERDEDARVTRGVDTRNREVGFDESEIERRRRRHTSAKSDRNEAQKLPAFDEARQRSLYTQIRGGNRTSTIHRRGKVKELTSISNRSFSTIHNEAVLPDKRGRRAARALWGCSQQEAMRRLTGLGDLHMLVGAAESESCLDKGNATIHWEGRLKADKEEKGRRVEGESGRRRVKPKEQDMKLEGRTRCSGRHHVVGIVPPRPQQVLALHYDDSVAMGQCLDPHRPHSFLLVI